MMPPILRPSSARPPVAVVDPGAHERAVLHQVHRGVRHLEAEAGGERHPGADTARTGRPAEEGADAGAEGGDGRRAGGGRGLPARRGGLLQPGGLVRVLRGAGAVLLRHRAGGRLERGMYRTRNHSQELKSSCLELESQQVLHLTSWP